LTDLDKKTLRVAAVEFGKQLARKNVGRLNIFDWLLDPGLSFPTTAEDEVAQYHHMCTTRMSEDPKKGVVDRNCRIHSVDNLYVGGSSVFGAPGFANPTFTIVQLALRLGDHLSDRLMMEA
jgi:choline dehydrogenase-like flavoprotein